MVSKAVLVALVALCCAAVSGARREEIHPDVMRARGVNSCVSAAYGVVTIIIPETIEHYGLYSKIFAEAKELNAKCVTDHADDTGAITTCKKEVTKATVLKVKDETINLVNKIGDNYETIEKVVDCILGQ